MKLTCYKLAEETEVGLKFLFSSRASIVDGRMRSRNLARQVPDILVLSYFQFEQVENSSAEHHRNSRSPSDFGGIWSHDGQVEKSKRNDHDDNDLNQ